MNGNAPESEPVCVAFKRVLAGFGLAVLIAPAACMFVMQAGLQILWWNQADDGPTGIDWIMRCGLAAVMTWLAGVAWMSVTSRLRSFRGSTRAGVVVMASAGSIALAILVLLSLSLLGPLLN